MRARDGGPSIGEGLQYNGGACASPSMHRREQTSNAIAVATSDNLDGPDGLPLRRKSVVKPRLQRRRLRHTAVREGPPVQTRRLARLWPLPQCASLCPSPRAEAIPPPMAVPTFTVCMFIAPALT